MSNFPMRLAGLREQLKLTQKELAEKLGVAPSTIGMYETGRRQPDLQMLELLADYFNVSIDYLTGKEDIATHVELLELREELRHRPEMRMLFSLAKGATTQDLNRVVKLMELFKREAEGED